MLTFTRADLHKKSDRQLAALFNLVNSSISDHATQGPERALASTLLSMIARERSARRQLSLPFDLR